MAAECAPSATYYYDGKLLIEVRLTILLNKNIMKIIRVNDLVFTRPDSMVFEMFIRIVLWLWIATSSDVITAANAILIIIITSFQIHISSTSFSAHLPGIFLFFWEHSMQTINDV